MGTLGQYSPAIILHRYVYMYYIYPFAVENRNTNLG